MEISNADVSMEADVDEEEGGRIVSVDTSTDNFRSNEIWYWSIEDLVLSDSEICTIHRKSEGYEHAFFKHEWCSCIGIMIDDLQLFVEEVALRFDVNYKWRYYVYRVQALSAIINEQVDRNNDKLMIDNTHIKIVRRMLKLNHLQWNLQNDKV